MSGDKISDMTDSLTVFPDGAFVPMIVTTNTSGLVTTANYRYNAGLYLAKLSTLAATTGAALIGSTGPSTVQADITARPTSATLAASGGSALIGTILPETGAVARTVEDKLSDSASILDFQANADTGANCTAAFQAAIDAGNVTFPPGTYTMTWASISDDIYIPSNRTIWVQKGATITMTGGRFTVATAGADNIEWRIDGAVRSVAMRTAADRPSWSGISDERGFIEFGEPYVPGSAASGFKVHGAGEVSGDWTGTPNFSDPTAQVNRKGIACWNTVDAEVRGLNVFGFDGEAIYGYNTSGKTAFEDNYVHDTRFNALNFNAGPDTDAGSTIRNNVVVDAYQIEANGGSITDNSIKDVIADGIYTGGSGGIGPIVISRNTIVNVGRHAISADFASGTPVTSVTIADNVIETTEQYGIYCNYVRELKVTGNRITDANNTGSYGIGVEHTLRGRVSDNYIMAPGGSTSGPVFVDPTTCFDVSMDPNSNVYTPTTGTAPPYVNNGIQDVASVAAVTLPILGSIFRITGTTNITSMVATGNTGRTVTLYFADILTFTDGSNLKLAGNLVTTADDTITLFCNGTDWFEICRSVN